MYTETTDTKGINVEVDETDAVPYTDMELEVYSPEEAYELIMSDIRSIYGIKRHHLRGRCLPRPKHA